MMVTGSSGMQGVSSAGKRRVGGGVGSKVDSKYR